MVPTRSKSRKPPQTNACKKWSSAKIPSYQVLIGISLVWKLGTPKSYSSSVHYDFLEMARAYCIFSHTIGFPYSLMWNLEVQPQRYITSNKPYIFIVVGVISELMVLELWLYSFEWLQLHTKVYPPWRMPRTLLHLMRRWGAQASHTGKARESHVKMSQTWSRRSSLETKLG